MMGAEKEDAPPG